jgi:uncharacterized membrane protein
MVWAAWEWRGSSRRLALALKALMLAAIILALAEPRVTVFESKMAVAILADTSASLSQQDLDRESSLAGQIEKSRGRNWTQVIPFARSTRTPDPNEHARGWNLKYTAGEPGRGTDLEAAIRDAIAALPAGMVPRVVLLSDGKENLGSVARAGWQARQLGVPIDTFALGGRPRPSLRLESVNLPARAFTGERFPIDLVVTSPARTDVTVEIAAEGKALGKSRVALEPGTNRVRVHANVNVPGAIDLSGTLNSAQLGEARFAAAISLRRPKLLVISHDPAGTDVNLMRTLESGQFDIEKSSGALPDDLSGFQLIVFNNWDLEAIPPARKVNIEEFVKQGGGLLVIGGERNIYRENRPADDALERALPARLAPPRSPKGTCVVLVVDKSSSMEGKKIELARLAAIGVIDNLRPIDWVGVLIFDNSFQWAVPIRKAEDPALIKRLVSGIVPDGGTQIAPALAEAYKKALPVNALYKHIVLLTDGISEEGDSLSLSREAAAHQVTISTVGLGQDVNRAYLEKVAAVAKGMSYFLNEPAGLEQILLRDVMEHTGATAIEKQVTAVVVKPAEILDGVEIDSAPPLKGYVKFIAKPTADTILSLSSKDPLLVRWQYQLGRSAVFTSDAKSRWAANWVTWKGYDTFWSNLFRDLLPRSQEGEATVDYDSAADELVVDYRLARNAEEPAVVPDVYVFGAGGFQRPVQVSKVAEGAFRGRVPIGHRRGFFRLRPLAESRAFPEVGFYREEEELSEYGSNEFLLRQISDFTGGRFEPGAKQVFDAGGRSVSSVLRLWPALIALAIALNLIELILRKWKGIWSTLKGVGQTPPAA